MADITWVMLSSDWPIIQSFYGRQLIVSIGKSDESI